MREAGEGGWRRALAAAAAAGLLVAVPAAAVAQAVGTVSGLLVRVQGDVSIDAQESADLVVVVSGDANVAGRAGAVVVVGGTARLVNARVGRLVVVRGSAELSGSTRVLGDVWLVGAGLTDTPGAVVGGSVRTGLGGLAWRALAAEPRLAGGLLALALVAGWLAVAAGARTMRRAAAALSADLPGTLAAVLLLFVVGPGAALLLFFTVVGIPLSVGYLVVALPALVLLGFPVAALRLGEWVLRSRRDRPYWAVLLGQVLLAGFSLVPFVGLPVVAAAAAAGAGALALVGRRAYEGEGGGAAPAGEG